MTGCSWSVTERATLSAAVVAPMSSGTPAGSTAATLSLPARPWRPGADVGQALRRQGQPTSSDRTPVARVRPTRHPPSGPAALANGVPARGADSRALGLVAPSPRRSPARHLTRLPIGVPGSRSHRSVPARRELASAVLIGPGRCPSRTTSQPSALPHRAMAALVRDVRCRPWPRSSREWHQSGVELDGVAASAAVNGVGLGEVDPASRRTPRGESSARPANGMGRLGGLYLGAVGGAGVGELDVVGRDVGAGRWRPPARPRDRWRGPSPGPDR